MRDPVLNEALKRLAAEASTRFSSLVATGDEIPFDVAEDSGESSLFYRYVPLTTRFVQAHIDELHSLPSYGPARGAVVTAGAAAAYLEARGLPVSSEPNRRAEEMLDAFVSGLWEGTTGFSLDLARLESALDSLEVENRSLHEADILLAPLFGFEMTADEITFANGVRIVRSDTVDAPLEATSSEGTDRAAWQPAYLAIAPLDGRSDGPGRALSQLRELVRAMRLFKRGCVGLGPYAFAPVEQGEWRRMATGANGPRPGGYFLTQLEAEGLDEFIQAVTEGRPGADRVAWATERFEYGCERPRALDALSDHLLAIRSALSGEGVIDAPLAARAAALITGDGEDELARERMQRAIDTEQALIEGRSTFVAGAESASDLAAWVEDGAREILRSALMGELGEDAGAAAEETLLTSGLQAGEGSAEQMGATAEWGAIEAYGPERSQPARDEGGPRASGDAGETEPAGSRPGFEPEPETETELEVPDIFDSEPEARRLFAAEPLPEVTLETFAEYRTSDTDDDDAVSGDDRSDATDSSGKTRILEPVPEPDEISVTANKEINADWLGTGAGGATLEWPSDAISATRQGGPGGHGHRHVHRVESPRVRHLFPVPDDADWSVGELRYSRERYKQ